jgi:hypothetical protein
MNDPFLQALISIASNKDVEEPYEAGVTLLVGGFLVSGYVISRDKYMQHDPIFKVMWEEWQKSPQEPEPEAEKPGDDLPNFINLRDARYFATVGNPIPGNMPLYCRFTLDAVHGFSLGVLAPAGEEPPGTGR